MNSPSSNFYLDLSDDQSFFLKRDTDTNPTKYNLFLSKGKTNGWFLVGSESKIPNLLKLSKENCDELFNKSEAKEKTLQVLIHKLYQLNLDTGQFEWKAQLDESGCLILKIVV